MNTRLSYKTLFTTALLLSSSAWGQSNTSFGNLSQSALETFKRYIKTDLFYTHDYISNTGGAKAGPRNIGALDLYIESDFNKFSDINGQAQLHYIHINQPDSRGVIGDAQVASNIDVPVAVDRIADLWYQQNWTDKFKTLVGLHDISMEFNVTESSLSFLNSSFGTSAEISYSGANGPSVYPVTSLGLRSTYNFTEELSLRTGFYDANPGGVETYRSFHSDIGGNDGLLHISELAFQDDNQKAGFGLWNYSKAQPRFGTEKTANLYGTYGMYERKLSHSLYSFARAGWGNPITNEIQSNLATGVVYKGIFQRKKTNDEAGLGITQVHFSRQYMKNSVGSDSFNSRETAVEAFYQFKPFKQISLRPDVQYVSDPSGHRDLKNAWAMGLRTVVEI